MGIRNACKAIIVDRGKILLNKNRNSLGEMCYGLPVGAVYYDLPGGGQNQYESLEAAVRWECMEESGYAVAVDRLAAVYEEISTHEDRRREHGEYAHKVYFVFICRLTGERGDTVTGQDMDLLQSEWIPVEEIPETPLYPQAIHARLEEILHTRNAIYLGTDFI